MKKAQLHGITRVLLLIGGIVLLGALFLPIWRIELDAPQYPEGLKLLIFANRLAGDVEIINGLNHYIGMRTLHSDAFIEFKILPVIIFCFSALTLLASIVGRRKFLYKVCILFLLFGIVSMIDFWKWEYDYGHNLNPDAAIKVPGMAYQPPLIGFKQLLNFGAYSMLDAGGWIFAAVGVLLVGASFWEYRKAKLSMTLAFILPLFFLSSCGQGPSAIKPGTDHCDFCKMTISDARFAGELVTQKGRVYKFDDLHCLLAYLKATPTENGKYYVSDYEQPFTLQPADKMIFVESAELKGPMGGQTAAFSDKEATAKYNGKTLTWKEILP